MPDVAPCRALWRRSERARRRRRIEVDVHGTRTRAERTGDDRSRQVAGLPAERQARRASPAPSGRAGRCADGRRGRRSDAATQSATSTIGWRSSNAWATPLTALASARTTRDHARTGRPVSSPTTPAMTAAAVSVWVSTKRMPHSCTVPTMSRFEPPPGTPNTSDVPASRHADTRSSAIARRERGFESMRRTVAGRITSRGYTTCPSPSPSSSTSRRVCSPTSSPSGRTARSSHSMSSIRPTSSSSTNRSRASSG